MRRIPLVLAICIIPALVNAATPPSSDSAPPSTRPFTDFPTTQATTIDQSQWQLLLSRAKASERPVDLQITLKNVGSATMKFPLELAEIQGSKSFILQIKRPDGSLLPLTLLGHRLYEPDTRFPRRIEYAGAELGAGQSFTATLPADRIFDLSMDGVYHVTVWVFVWKIGGSYCFPIKSNELVMTLASGGY